MSRKSGQFARLAGSLLAAAGLALGQAAAPPARLRAPTDLLRASAAPQYVGNTACQSCHQEEFSQYRTSPHAKIALAAHGNPARQGCESCHGPGAAHVADPGDSSKIFSFTAASPGQANQHCLACHSTGREQANFATSIHAQNHVNCLDCHSSHHAQTPKFLLIKTQPALCYTCHGTERAQFNLPTHHKVNEGLVQCSDCHNPHGTPQPKMLRTASALDAVCYTCHADKRGPFVFEHAPVKVDGCTACHTPHGSPNLHLLKYSNVNLLCLTCHTQSSFSQAPGTPSFHNQTTQWQSCLTCHTQIHGSNFDANFFH